jgi:hypothetical protein
MPLDPNIILQAGNFPRADGGQMLRDAFGIVQAQEGLAGRRDARAMQQRQMAAQDAALAKAAEKEARLSTIGGMAAGGDVAGAQRTALEAGDFDAYKQLAALGDDQRKAVSAKYAAAAPVALAAAQYPMAVRRNVIMAAAPQLKAAGWTDEEIAGFDPNDANIQGLVASQQTVDQINQQLDRDRKFGLDKDKFGYQQQNDAIQRAFTASENAKGRQATLTAASMRANQGPPLARIPPAAANGILGNVSALRKVDAAMAALKGRPSSVGVGTGALGSTFTNLNDPGGTATRAAIAEISATKIHDLSGAAVSAAEFPRLAPFVPLVSDPPDVAAQKLEKFKEVLTQELEQQKQFYGPQNGYVPVQGLAAPPEVPQKKLPPGGGVMKAGGGTLTAPKNGVREWRPG